MTPERLRTADFEYDLPTDLIAQEPLPDRGGSRLLLVQRDPQRLLDSRFTELPSLISPGDLLVINTTRVRHARLIATRQSGAPAEVLLIHPGVGWNLDRHGEARHAPSDPASGLALGPEEWVETVRGL